MNVNKTPLICLPITGTTKKEVMSALAIIEEKLPDMIELRADYLEDIANTKKVIELVNTVCNATTLPILFTIRSVKEGGETIPLNELEVATLLGEVAKHTKVDWIDYEVNNAKELVQQVMYMAHDNEKKVVLSYHNFNETPENKLLLDYFEKMDTFNANFAKIAVMPKTKADVRRLLEVTAIADEQLSIPIITMSMGELGEVSRVIGWIYGSVLTFGVGVASSAPGQIAIEPLRKAIESVQQISENIKLT